MNFSRNCLLEKKRRSVKYNLIVKSIVCLSALLIPFIGFDIEMIADTTVKFESGNLPFHNPTPGRIAIVASTPIPSTVEPTRRAYQDLIECGFNAFIFTGSEEYTKQQFELTKDLDLKLLIRNADLYNNNYKQYINTFKKYPALGGWNFYDEPTYAKLGEVKGYYDRLYALDPDHLIFMSLIGMNITQYTGPSKDMIEYLNLIQKEFHPALWSFDLYPFYEYDREVKLRCDQFYPALEVYSEMSRKTSRPFWAYCQSMSFKTKSLKRPVAKEEYLRFTIFSFLAYGAQGILYWTYGQRPSNDNETYLSALVDLKGKKTSVWKAAKKVNHEIIQYNDIFYGCKVKEIKHTGKTYYEGTARLTGEFGPFSKVTTGNEGALFSRLTNNGREFIIIVTHDVKNSQNLTLTLSENKEVKLLSENKGFTQEGNQISLKLSKGEYAIFEII